MIRALEVLGNLLDQVTHQHEQLPNEFTRGQVSGVSGAYSAVQRLISGENTDRPDAEGIPFSTPPKMIKYGGNDATPPRVGGADATPPDYPSTDQTVDMIQQIQRGQVGDPQLEELQEIKGLLNDIYNLMQSFSEGVSESAHEIVKKAQQAQILNDVAAAAQEAGHEIENPLDAMIRDSQEAGLYDQEYSPEDFKRGMELDAEEQTKWNKSFGQRLRGQSEELDQKATERIAELRGEKPAPYGSRERLLQLKEEEGVPIPNQGIRRNFVPGFEPDNNPVTADAYEETFDPNTGEKGRQRRIGMKFNPDEDQPTQTVEEWERKGPNHPKVYLARPDDNELQDLGPGE